MAFDIGETIGDYQITGILGAGGMGKVYKARNVISDRVEAMKVLLPDLVNQEALADRFTREIKLLASLNHPNIAALHTALRVQNQLLMIMEFVEGRTLEDRLKDGPIPVPEAIDYISQALSALAYAHERGVVHRDIKPANLMVTAARQVKLMDFGIARAVADRRLTTTGATLGSLYYMSPEQVRGSADLDGRSDLYSVGVSLYEMVTGTRPIKGDSDYAIMAAHLGQQPVPPIQVDPSLPPALNEIILTAIAKDPAQRFQSAQALRAALESVRAGLAPAPPLPATPPPPPPPAPSRRDLWMALGAVLVLAVLAVMAIQLPRWYRARAGGSTPAAAQPAPAAVKPPEAVPEPPSAKLPEAQAPLVTTKPAPAEPKAAPPSAAVAPAQEAPPATQPEPVPPQPGVDTSALEQQRDRFGLLATRANALNGSLQNLEQQQRASGLGLRTDISMSWKRMQYLLDEAESALKRSDLAAAKKNLDAGEREADKLDRFLGH